MTLSPAFITIALVVISAAGPALHAETPAQPKLLKFAISSAANPGGKGSYGGTVAFSRQETHQGFRVAWQLSDGSAQSGFAVPYPDSGVIAVGYGEDLTGIAIYKKDGTKVDARWTPALPDSAIGSYQLTRGDQPGVMVVENRGGTVTLTEGPEETGTAEFKLTTGASSGIVIGQDNFLAIASGGKRIGVVLYQKTAHGVEGRWTFAGATGAGKENLTILEVDGKKIDGPGKPPVPPVPSADAEEIPAIAKALSGNLKALLKLKPTRAQLDALAATPEDAARLQTYVDALFAELPAGGLKADAGETNIVVFSGDDLPGGYAQQASHLKPEVKIYGFKYLDPAKDSGTSFDGLIKIKGQWIMIPKLWSAFQ